MRTLPFLLLVLLLAGCGGSGTRGFVSIDGSTSMADVTAVLQETFREREPGITVNYSGTGSGSGVEAVLAGRCDLGASSRSLKDAEREQGAAAHLIALDGLAVVVHPDNPITDLTAEQLAQIFTGAIRNWSELGGVDAPIAACGREAGSGTRGAFEEILGVTDRCTYTNEYGSTGDVVGNVAGNPNAVGYASLSAVGQTVRAVRVDGAACTEEAIRDGSYPIQRPFLLVTSRHRPLSAEARAFLDYAQSPEAADYLAIAGVVAP